MISDRKGYLIAFFAALAMLAGCGTNVGAGPQATNPTALAHAVPRIVAPSSKSRYKETILYTFCPGGKMCPDGVAPHYGLVFGDGGALYGTTQGGGKYKCYSGHSGCGVVFKLAPSDSGYLESDLYKFCKKSGCSDGSFPDSGLIFDKEGALYGTTAAGGSKNGGTVFKLTPSGSGYRERVLYSFCQASGCSDGASPVGGVILDKSGALYGTTELGGAYDVCGYYHNQGCGTAFKLTPSGSDYTESVLYSFCKKPGCRDGASPLAGAILDKKGALYGTTEFGGGTNSCYYTGGGCGTAFKLAPSGLGYTESTLYSFCKKSPCNNGALPVAGLIFDKNGALYGTTTVGGIVPCYYSEGSEGCGTAFKLAPSGAGYTESVLYRFCSKPFCRDGWDPLASLIFDDKGALYGTTVSGGNGRAGTVFKLSPSGSGYAEHVLHRFEGSAPDTWPEANLIFDKNGALYSTSGGDTLYSSGSVWKLER